MLLDKVVRPITITHSGANAFLISSSVKNKEECAIAFGNEIGSSAITGQFNFLAKPITSATENPPRSCPITNTPDLTSNLATNSLLFFNEVTCNPLNQSTLCSEINGSSNCGFK